MVHALGQIHRLLQPGGWLINVHDLPVPHVIEVHTPETVYKAGWLVTKNDFIDTRSALMALAQVVTQGEFLLEDERDFDYRIYVDSLEELQTWLPVWWSSAVIPEPIITRLAALTCEATQPSRIALVLRARMTKLSAL